LVIGLEFRRVLGILRGCEAFKVKIKKSELRSMIQESVRDAKTDALRESIKAKLDGLTLEQLQELDEGLWSAAKAVAGGIASVFGAAGTELKTSVNNQLKAVNTEMTKLAGAASEAFETGKFDAFDAEVNQLKARIEELEGLKEKALTARKNAEQQKQTGTRAPTTQPPAAAGTPPPAAGAGATTQESKKRR